MPQPPDEEREPLITPTEEIRSSDEDAADLRPRIGRSPARSHSPGFETPLSQPWPWAASKRTERFYKVTILLLGLGLFTVLAFGGGIWFGQHSGRNSLVNEPRPPFPFPPFPGGPPRSDHRPPVEPEDMVWLAGSVKGISEDALKEGLKKCEAIKVTRGKREDYFANPPAPEDSVNRKRNPRHRISAENELAGGVREGRRVAAPVVIRNATLLDGDGSFKPNTDIVLDAGLVFKVAPTSDVQVEAVASELGVAVEDLTVVDVGGRIVTPGLVDMHSHMGTDSWPGLDATSDTNEMSESATVPFIRSIDGFNPQDIAIQIIMSGGVTTSMVLPGSGTLMGGEAFVFKHRLMESGRAEDMLLNAGMDPEGEDGLVWRYMKMACGENAKRFFGGRGMMPESRLGEGWLFRQQFEHARALIADQNDWCESAGETLAAFDGNTTRAHRLITKRFPEDLKRESLVALLRGDVRLNVHCYETWDLEMMVRHSHEFGFNITAFHHALEAWQVPELLASNNISAALFADHWGYKKEAYGTSVRASKILTDAGVKVAFKSDHPVLNAQHLIFEAAKAHHYGLPADLAIQAVTSVPADRLGAGWRIGRLLPGYDADVVVWDRHPLRLGAHPLKVWIDGFETFAHPLAESALAMSPVPSSLRPVELRETGPVEGLLRKTNPEKGKTDTVSKIATEREDGKDYDALLRVSTQKKLIVTGPGGQKGVATISSNGGLDMNIHKSSIESKSGRRKHPRQGRSKTQTHTQVKSENKQTESLDDTDDTSNVMLNSLPAYFIKNIGTLYADESTTMYGPDLTVFVKDAVVRCIGSMNECGAEGEKGVWPLDEEVVVFDVMNGTVIPGIIASHVRLGLEEIESEWTTRDGRAIGFDPASGGTRAVDGLRVGLDQSKQLTAAFRAGVVAAVAVPRASGLVKGQSTAFWTGADGFDDAVVQDVTGVTIVLGKDGADGSTVSNSYAGQIGLLRRLLLSHVKTTAQEFIAGEMKTGNKNDENATSATEGSSASPFADVVAGRLTMFAEVQEANDVSRLLKLKQEVENALSHEIDNEREQMKRKHGKNWWDIISGDIEENAEAEKAKKEARAPPKMKVTVIGGGEAWMVADQLAAASVPVILRPARCTPGIWETRRCILPGTGAILGNDNTAIFSSANSDSTTRVGDFPSVLSATEILHQAGVPVGLTPLEDNFVRGLLWEAGWAYADSQHVSSIARTLKSISEHDQGLTKSEAIGLITWNVAGAMGIDAEKAEYAGRIQIGKWAGLVAYLGCPLEFGARIQLVSDGRRVLVHPVQD
ncbi:hypothetical protein HK102_004600 [Quaeritorhiza haematococci]|nr:hypothetical protein HK102_004600 [Quaeritorhiza haematococci]